MEVNEAFDEWAAENNLQEPGGEREWWLYQAFKGGYQSATNNKSEALEFGDHMAKAIDGWISAAAAGDPDFSFITIGDVLMVEEYRRLRAD